MKTTRKLIVTIIAASMLTTTPAWAADSQSAKKDQATIINPQNIELTPSVMRTIEGLPQRLPQMTNYVALDVSDVVNDVVNIGLYERDVNRAVITPDGVKRDLFPLGFVHIDRNSGELMEVRISGIRLNDGKTIVDDNTLKERASDYVRVLQPDGADQYQLVSVWKTDEYDLGKKVGQSVQLNFRSPVHGNAEKANYVEINLTGDGRLLGYKKMTKPIAYDSWYVAPLDKRTKPNDVLSDESRRSLDKVSQILPMIKSYTHEKIESSDDGTAKLVLSKDGITRFPSVYITFNKDGSIHNLVVDDLRIQPATDELAKQKAASFIKDYLGDTAQVEFQLKEIARNENITNLPTGSVSYATKSVRFFNPKTEKWLAIEVSSAGEICGFLGPVEKTFYPY
ncbi:hypothetical protein ACFSO0_10010 [Brevibacillus sp. GCM10020057]|uniref:hypothetical protein n=1 Tax=Brevibacillus sp. GCM10020057 TaxID=3317327 RepID=UPI003644957A